MLAAGAEGWGWRACQADQNSSSPALGAMKTSPSRPGGQQEWSSRGALSMRSISPLVAWRQGFPV
jgi:hypothetical protein